MKFLKILASLWLLLALFGGLHDYYDEPSRDKRHKDAIQFEMRPYVRLVESFRKKHRRLPTEAEYDTLVVNQCGELPSGYSREGIDTLSFHDKISACKGLAYVYARKQSSIPDYANFPFISIDWETNYVIAFTRRGWFEYYISQNDNYTVDDYQSRGVWGIIISCIVGLAPLLLIIGIRKIWPDISQLRRKFNIQK